MRPTPSPDPPQATPTYLLTGASTRLTYWRVDLLVRRDLLTGASTYLYDACCVCAYCAAAAVPPSDSARCHAVKSARVARGSERAHV